MTDAEQQVLARLGRDNVEFLWVAFHDYLGRACAKTNPRSGLASAVHTGMVFAKANLNMDAHDRQVSRATLLADMGDFMAVPDPRSYALLPRYPGTALMHSWMREPDGSPWEGCPRTRLDKIVAKLGAEGLSVQAALEPEFYLFFGSVDGDLAPITRSTMYGQAGLANANDLIVDLMNELAGMGIGVAQFHKEYGRGQYELSLGHGSPIEAVDRYLQFRTTLHDIARKHGMIATLMPKPTAESPGNSLHVHISIWNADGSLDFNCVPVRRCVAFGNGDVVHGWLACPRPRADCRGVSQHQQLQASLAGIMGTGQRLLGRWQPLGLDPRPRHRIAPAHRIPFVRQHHPALSAYVRTARRWPGRNQAAN